MKDLIIVKAKVSLKTTEEGGRITGIKSGYRPDHVFEPFSEMNQMGAFMGDIKFEDQEVFQPGETKIVMVRFLYTQIIEKYMKVGQKWLFYEGPRLVGNGEIVEV